jgi:hypothetical protein
MFNYCVEYTVEVLSRQYVHIIVIYSLVLPDQLGADTIFSAIIERIPYMPTNPEIWESFLRFLEKVWHTEHDTCLKLGSAIESWWIRVYFKIEILPHGT